MRIGIISDTHIGSKADILPKEILEDFKKVDMIFHAGDLTDLSVIDKLKEVCKKVHAVYGNMDPYEVRQKLPEKKIISAGGHKIGLVHGYGHPDRLKDVTRAMFKGSGVDIIVYGHAHYPENVVEDGILFFNPGSPLDKIFAPYNSYGILEVNDEVKAEIVKL